MMENGAGQRIGAYAPIGAHRLCSHRVQETPGNQKQADNRRGNPLDSGEDF